MPSFQKNKPVRLKGKRLKALHEAAYARNNGLCQKCGEWVPPGVPCHHIIPKSQGGEDTMENLTLLCLECHYKEHF